MAKFKIYTGALLLLLLVTGAGWVVAQAPSDITVVGSAIANALIERLAEASGATSLAITSGGTTDGIDQFCNGKIDLVTATRPMTAAERAICAANDVVQSELLIGHHIVSFITSADAAVECLSQSQLRDVLKPSASNAVTDWSFAGEDMAELPLTLLLPADHQIEYFIADSLVPGDGLRLDAQTIENAADRAALVGETEGSLALLAGLEAKKYAEAITIVEISNDNAGDCTSPSAEGVASGDYEFALPLYVVVNRARLNASDSLADFMQFVVGESGADATRAAGLTPPTETTLELNALILSDADAAASASGDGDEYQIPLELNGEVKLVGAANAYQILRRVGDKLTESYERFSYDFTAAAPPTGLNSLCNGEADIALLDDALDPDALEACAAKSLVALPLELGAQATVLLANAGDEHSACLTTEQVSAIWGASSGSDAANWTDIDAAFPDQQLTLFGLSFTDQYTDILLQRAAEVIPPVRRDTEKDYDPLYRAAAVGNVAGGLTYMSWPDYQNVIANQQANIQLVALDQGSGCVEPHIGSIEDRSYALSRPASLLIGEESLAKSQVQSFLWSLADDDNWSLLERDGFVGASTLDLPIIRRNLSTWFTQAEAAYPQEGSDLESGDEIQSAGDDSSEDASE